MLIGGLWLNWHQRCHSLPPLKRISSRDSGEYAKCGKCVYLWLVKPEGRHYYRLRVAKILICLYYPYCLLCLDYQVWSNMLWSLVCDQLKGVDAFDHTRPWLVLLLDLLNSWVRTLLKTGNCLHGCHIEWCKILACLLRFGPLFSLAVGSRMISWTSDQFGDRRRLQLVSQKAC